jgi:hypothetical protein
MVRNPDDMVCGHNGMIRNRYEMVSNHYGMALNPNGIVRNLNERVCNPNENVRNPIDMVSNHYGMVCSHNGMVRKHYGGKPILYSPSDYGRHSGVASDSTSGSYAACFRNEYLLMVIFC